MSHLRHYAVLVTDSRKEVEQAHLKAQSQGKPSRRLCPRVSWTTFAKFPGALGAFTGHVGNAKGRFAPGAQKSTLVNTAK